MFCLLQSTVVHKFTSLALLKLHVHTCTRGKCNIWRKRETWLVYSFLSNGIDDSQYCQCVYLYTIYCTSVSHKTWSKSMQKIQRRCIHKSMLFNAGKSCQMRMVVGYDELYTVPSDPTKSEQNPPGVYEEHWLQNKCNRCTDTPI